MDTTNLSVSEYGGEEEDEEEDDYIDMELSSSPSPQSREFEFQFQICAASNHPQTATSPADRLFYKGKLLPLYLLHPTTTATEEEDTYYSLPFTAPSTDDVATTPLDSCNITPSESCRASGNLNSDYFLFEWSSTAAVNGHRHHQPTKISPWPKKLHLIKQIKASRAYLKSLFVKSACASHHSAAKPNRSSGPPQNPKNSKRKPLGPVETAPYPSIAAIISNIKKEGGGEDNNNNNSNAQRRSFSSAIKRYSPTKRLSSSSSSNSSSGSSSFSLNSNGGLHELHHCLRRSSSATEIEGSIEAAIAHCKKSQQNFQSKNVYADMAE